MSLNFIQKVPTIGGGNTEPGILTFYKNGFNLGTSIEHLQDVILRGYGSLILSNAKADGLNYVKLFGVCGQKYDGLPVGYKRLTYLESNRKQIVNLKYTPLETDIIEIDYEFTDLSGNSDKFIMGLKRVPSQSGGVWIETYGSGNGWYVRFGSSSSSTAQFQQSQMSGTMILKKNSFSVNGTKIATPNYVGIPDDDLTIFARYNSSSDGFAGTSVRISEVRIKDNNSNIKHKYVPILNANNVAGMYDTVDGVFYENLGTENFTLGAVIEPTPTNPLPIWCNNGEIKSDENGEPYVDGTIETVKDSLNNTATAENLLALDGYEDDQELLTGSVTRKVVAKVIKGTETWYYSTANNAIYARLSNTYAGLTVQQTQNAYCTHFKFNPGSTISSMNDMEFLFNAVDGVRNGNISLKYDSVFTSAEAAKQWVADQYANGTPIIVVVPLAEPVTESVSGQELTTKTGTNTIEITQSSIENLELEVSYKATM